MKNYWTTGRVAGQEVRDLASVALVDAFSMCIHNEFQIVVQRQEDQPVQVLFKKSNHLLGLGEETMLKLMKAIGQTGSHYFSSFLVVLKDANDHSH